MDQRIAADAVGDELAGYSLVVVWCLGGMKLPPGRDQGVQVGVVRCGRSERVWVVLVAAQTAGTAYPQLAIVGRHVSVVGHPYHDDVRYTIYRE